MEAGQCVEVLNPYDWLPGYGENSVKICTKELDLVVLVAYDGEDGEQQEKKISFKNTCGFYKGSFPGPSLLEISNNVEDKENLIVSGRLVEFPNSEAASICDKYYQGARSFKHYKLIFLSENVSLEIFAESVQLENINYEDIGSAPSE